MICLNWTVPFCSLFAFNTVFPGFLHLATLGLLLPAALGCAYIIASIAMLYLSALPVTLGPPPKLCRVSLLAFGTAASMLLCVSVGPGETLSGIHAQEWGCGSGVHICGFIQVLPACFYNGYTGSCTRTSRTCRILSKS